MAEDWYIKQSDGTVSGPFFERDVSADLLSGKISDEQSVRQGSNGPWCDAARARTVFRQLTEVGWYVRANSVPETNQEIFGPFTDAKLLQLHRDNELEPGAEVRQGTSGKWKSAEAVLSLWQQQKVPESNPATEDEQEESVGVGKWSIEPLRHTVIDLEVPYAKTVNKCAVLEHLLLQQTDEDNMEGRLLLTRTNGQRVGFLSIDNSSQILMNSERGLSHVCLLYSSPAASPIQIAVVLCPPGSTSEACKQYIEEHLRQRLEDVSS